ncbi:hypothetical protein EGN72_10465 [Pseudorhodobacter sp. E13]|uniref:hypothetical protein n=1 Tax=Pseudorhodobacter sp. E13 TaxID=2487931 RepID=UPI000F8F626F|nr:hypothetical protein [Pseudorhodobacter sp. E13]RUS60208.1 hypothetical protein EGN72_10465 [Pseudorhodobacter sp. E13]
MNANRHAIPLILALCLPIGAARAETLVVSGGVKLLSDSISNGHTLSNGKASAQAYVEAEIAGFFAEIYFATVRNGTDDTEIDYTLGYRNALDSGLHYQLSYSRYTLNNSGNCCGQISFELGQQFNDQIDLTGTIAYDPSAKIVDTNVELTYTLSDQWSLAAKLGREQQSHSYASLGVTYWASENTSLTLRLHDSSDEKPRIAGLLEYDFTLLSR